MKKRFFTLLFALVAMVTIANAQVVFNATNFPDPNFRAALMEQVQLIVYSHNSDGECIRNKRDIREGDVIYNNGFYDDRGHFHEGGNCSYTYRYTYGRSNKVNYSIFDVAYKSITNLTGIEHFTILEWLECYDNQLTSLDVSQNTALKKLSCDRNQLTSLDVSKNTALKDLNCGQNQLTSLDVSKNAALTELMCGYNQLTSLDVSKNTALTLLSCDGNPLTSLDVSKNAALTELYCLSNQLTSLDVSKNAALTTLYCSENQLTSLDVSGCTALTQLWCFNNQLTSLDVSKNAALTGLNCSDNQLTSLDVSGCTALTSLFCDGNQLTSLDVSKNAALTSLSCDGNQLTSLDVSKNAALTGLYCSSNQLASLDVSKNTALKKLSCDRNQLTSLDVSKNPALSRLECYGNQLTSLDVSKNTALKYLYCYGNQIKGEAMDALVASLPTVESGSFYVINTKDENEGNICTKAQVAVAKEKGWTVYDYNGSWDDCQEYEGSDEAILLDEETFPDDNFRNALSKYFDIPENYEITGDLISVTTKLDISNNKITNTIGIEHLTSLEELWCHCNIIAGEAMARLIASLTNLNVSEAKGLMLTEETNPRKGALYVLDFTDENEQNVCTAEHVEAANAKGWTVYCKRASGWEEYNGAKSGILLNEVFFPDTNFRSELSDLFGIGEGDEVTENMIATGMLMIQKSSIADLAGIEYFTNLRTLLCGENPLTLLDVSKNTKLQRLNCKGYGQGLLASLNVSGCAILETLECDDNQLTSIDASNNPELYMLSCNNNQLSSLDLSKNTKLESLKCSNNSLTSLVVSDNASRMKILECDLNNINGETMQNLVESLPTVTNGELYVIDTSNPNENNEITKQQVSIAKEKGWTVYDKNGGSKVEYAGIDIDTPTDINSVDSGELTDDSWYTIDGKKLAGEPKEKGIYIRNGRKVVK